MFSPVNTICKAANGSSIRYAKKNIQQHRDVPPDGGSLKRLCVGDAGASEALRGGLVPACGASNEHSGRPQPQLEPVPAVTFQVNPASVKVSRSRFSSQWLHASNRFLPSAPNGNYSATSLQSVRDELFINIFDEMVYESGPVGNAAKSSSAVVRQHGFSLLLALLRATGREGSPCTPG